MHLTRYIVLMITLQLSACSEPQDPQSGIAEEDRLFNTQRQALEKAKGVEGMLKDNLQAQEQKLQEAEDH